MYPSQQTLPQDEFYRNLIDRLCPEIKERALSSPRVHNGNAAELIQFIRENFADNKWAINGHKIDSKGYIYLNQACIWIIVINAYESA